MTINYQYMTSDCLGLRAVGTFCLVQRILFTHSFVVCLLEGSSEVGVALTFVARYLSSEEEFLSAERSLPGQK